MEFHQLRYVCAIADTGNFSRAAERCQIAQPSLSQQVLKLEEDLGAKLFDRLGRSVRLTEAGRAFIPHARAVLAEMEVARAERCRQERRLSRQHSRGCDSNGRALSDPELYGGFCKEVPRRETAHRRRNDIGSGRRSAGPVHRRRDSCSPITPQRPKVVSYPHGATLRCDETRSSTRLRRISCPQRSPRRIVRHVARRPLFPRPQHPRPAPAPALLRTSPSKAASSAVSWGWLRPVSVSRSSLKWLSTATWAAATYALLTLRLRVLSLPRSCADAV